VRAEGIGRGWVSILEPAKVSALPKIPADWRFVRLLCLGYPQPAIGLPLLQTEGWQPHPAVKAMVIGR